MVLFENFVRKYIYKDFNIFFDDVVSVLASKGHYNGIVYNEETQYMTDDQYYNIIEAKINQLKLYDRVNLVILNIIKYLAESDEEKKEEICHSVNSEFETTQIKSVRSFLDFLQYELFSYIYGTNFEKPLLLEELEYFKVTTENIFNRLQTIFDDQITKLAHSKGESTEYSPYKNFSYSDNILY